MAPALAPVSFAGPREPILYRPPHLIPKYTQLGALHHAPFTLRPLSTNPLTAPRLLDELGAIPYHAANVKLPPQHLPKRARAPSRAPLPLRARGEGSRSAFKVLVIALREKLLAGISKMRRTIQGSLGNLGYAVAHCSCSPIRTSRTGPVLALQGKGLLPIVWHRGHTASLDRRLASQRTRYHTPDRPESRPGWWVLRRGLGS